MHQSLLGMKITQLQLWYGGSVFDDGWSLLYENKKGDYRNIK